MYYFSINSDLKTELYSNTESTVLSILSWTLQATRQRFLNSLVYNWHKAVQSG